MAKKSDVTNQGSNWTTTTNPTPPSLLRRLWRLLYWNALYPLREAAEFRRLTAGDPEKRRMLRLVRPNTMVGPARLANAWDLVRRAEAAGVPGAIVECGVFKGGSSAVMASAASADRHIWLFDSFEGLPEPTTLDGEKAFSYAGNRADGALEPIQECVGPLETVEELFFGKLRIARERVHIRKGWFQDTLARAKHEIGPIAVLRLDGDWYESTRVCLEELYDLVAPGGFVIIDDYGYWEGCRKAVDEFLAKRALHVDLVPVDTDAVWWSKK